MSEITWVLGHHFPTKGETDKVEFKHVPICGNLLEMRYHNSINEGLLNALYTYNDVQHKLLSASGGNDDTPTLLGILDLVNPSVEYCLQWVFPKYLSSFCNSRIRGDLYLGISDDGEITGIPHLNTLNIDDVTSHLQYLCAEYVRIVHQGNVYPNIENELFSLDTLFTVTIIPLDTDIAILEDSIAPIMERWEQDTCSFNDDLFIYKEAYQKWSFELQRVSGKLINIVNTSTLRRELISYMDIHKELWTSMTFELRDQLNTMKYYHFNTSFEYFESSKEDPSKIWFWVTKFKEHTVSKLTTLKPYRPKLSTHIPLTIAVAKLIDLRYRYVTLGVQYSVINIKFNGNLLIDDHDTHIQFKYPHSEQFHSKKRAVSALGDPYTY